MNRYPLWKYITIGVMVVLGALYSAPNLFGELPAVQLSSGKSTVKLDATMLAKVQSIAADAKVGDVQATYEASAQSSTIKVRVASTDAQKKLHAAIESTLNPDKTDPSYIVALNMLPATPKWLQAFGAKPMYLGLDLRGGVHVLLQVDLKGAVDKRLKSLTGDIRASLSKEKLRHGGVSLSGTSIEVKVRGEIKEKVGNVLKDNVPEAVFVEVPDGDNFKLVGKLSEEAIRNIQDNAVKQNISTLHNRVNELGVSEPIIQQQGADRIVVQLPGVDDPTKVKDILGRTATLEVRMVDETVSRGSELTAPVPLGSELFTRGNGVPVVLYKDVIVTGESIVGASASFDQNQQPSVSLDLTSTGGKIMSQTTQDKVGKSMAVVLFEKNKGEVLTVATIQSELSSRFQITGMGTPQRANDLALLMRAGSLAAPMDIIEERTIGPSLGADNIQKGYNSMMYGFAAIAVFMIAYYLLFGTFSVIALAINMMLLFALLSILQATLTLPGMAAIALALGMAIDANVLINERVREELRHGAKPQDAINTGFERAWATILDSNVTTLIAGLALLAFGSGPIRGFAVVHCLGILTSMFSAVLVARGLVNLWYGGKKKLDSVSIGQVWKGGNLGSLGSAVALPEVLAPHAGASFAAPVATIATVANAAGVVMKKV
jgi:preprotein translocase subunit SecD